MAGGSKVAVYSAIGANSVVTVAKFVGFVLTGSSAMLSEAIHSVADVGNQVLLAVGMSRSSRAPDPSHPTGYGREAFVWALISAVGIFFIGCGFTLMHGIEAVQHPHHDTTGGMINVGILVFALVAEGITLGIAIRSIRHDAHLRHMGFIEHLKTTDDPFGVAVLLEDSAAVFGVLVALAAVLLTKYTHNPIWDGVASLIIGVLLGFVAVFLIWKNMHLLVGASVHTNDIERIKALLEAEPAIEKVVQQSAVVTGAKSFRLAAEIDFDGRFFANQYLEGKDPNAILGGIENGAAFRTFLEEYSEHLSEAMGAEVDRIEQHIREELPNADRIALEPD